MRRFVAAAALTAVAALAAAPALAITVSPVPTQEQAAHLRLQQQRSSTTSGIDVRDTFAGSGRAGDFYGSQGARTQTYSFGNVTTTITTGRDEGVPSFLDQDRFRSQRFNNDRLDSELLGRRR